MTRSRRRSRRCSRPAPSSGRTSPRTCPTTSSSSSSFPTSRERRTSGARSSAAAGKRWTVSGTSRRSRPPRSSTTDAARRPRPIFCPPTRDASLRRDAATSTPTRSGSGPCAISSGARSDEEESVDAVSGWRGDRIAFFVSGGALSYVWRLRFDTPGSALLVRDRAPEGPIQGARFSGHRARGSRRRRHARFQGAARAAGVYRSEDLRRRALAHAPATARVISGIITNIWIASKTPCATMQGSTLP